MNNDPRGTMTMQGNLMRIENAFVEEAFCSNPANGYLIVSYSQPDENNRNFIQTLRLNLNRNTVVMNTSGQRICLCCIREGMWINALFSSRMTRSIPPQSTAFFILAQRGTAAPPSVTTTGRIAWVDTDNRFLYTGNPGNINTQTRYVITDTTSITNRFGNPIRLSALRPGQTVRITHANFQTASIPPQTTAFDIQLL
ncbi:MAG: hypothetical protein J5986_11795 [Roseburia sp.]|nr:hypothetical protein [Roseburia sp.]